MPKGFWNLPVNPVWRVPGFMKGGKADNEHSNPVLLPLVPEFTNSCISHLQFLHFQKFLLEVVAIVRKKCLIGIRQLQSFAQYGGADAEGENKRGPSRSGRRRGGGVRGGEARGWSQRGRIKEGRVVGLEAKGAK
jgi:hypothetical protein